MFDLQRRLLEDWYADQASCITRPGRTERDRHLLDNTSRFLRSDES